jgi:uronate dehydrogenase
VRAALTADVRFAIVYGASANTRRWWPPDTEIGFVPQDDAEVYADALDGEDYAVQGGPNAAREHGGWAT